MAKKLPTVDDVDLSVLMGEAAPASKQAAARFVDAAQTAARIAQLRDDHAKAVRLHAQAEAGLQSVKDRLARVEDQLKELGIDPENAEVELQAAEEQLEELITQLTAALRTATAQYQTIIDATRTALGN